MKHKSIFGLLLIVSFVVQALVEIWYLPGIHLLVLLPWILAPAILNWDHRWFLLSFLIGLGWDLSFEAIIGPGMISWSMAAAFLWWLLSKVSGRAWWTWGAWSIPVTMLFWIFRSLSLRLLGVSSGLGVNEFMISVLSTSIYCLFLGIILKADLPSRWRRKQLRKLK